MIEYLAGSRKNADRVGKSTMLGGGKNIGGNASLTYLAKPLKLDRVYYITYILVSIYKASTIDIVSYDSVRDAF
ncbi:hypothetical protein GCM10007880_14620 [Mesorhizobium amorphae]|nr:hypothetical protein GCM10007880_14620 [Mesorhizobium amorphae]